MEKLRMLRTGSVSQMPEKYAARHQSITSLKGFHISPSFYSEDDDIINELAERVLTDGTKAVIRGRFEEVKETVKDLIKNSCLFLIDLTTEDEGYNMLHFAVCNKHPEIVKYLIDSGADAECTTKDDDNDTPLILAIRYYDSFSKKHTKAFNTIKREAKSVNILTFLLDKTDINAPNASGTTPLSLAVQKQDEHMVELLLDNPHIEVNQPDLQNYTPLHYACAGYRTEIITMLLETGADLFSKTDKGYIPIHIACQKGQSEVLEHLITKCPSERKQEMLEAKDNNGNTPLLLAKEAPTQAAFTLLETTHHCNTIAKNNNGDTVLHKFARNDDGILTAQLLENKQYLTMINEGNSTRDTPLHTACHGGRWKAAVILIEKNADYELKNAVGNTPLMVAIAGGRVEVVLHVLQAIKRVKDMKSHREIFNLPAKNNKTIIQWAIESDHIVLVEAILQIDLRLATTSDSDTGKTLLHIAAASGALYTIEILLNNKHACERLQSADSDGKTPLMLAAQNGHIDCVKILHDPVGNQTSCSCNTDLNGIDPGLNVMDKEGHTALHLACLNGHEEVVKYLCASSADLEACEGDGGTPLSCAASQGQKKIMNYLLGQDVDVNGRIIKSKTTPLILASQNGHESCVQMLLTDPNIDVTIQNKDGYNCLAVAAINRQQEAALTIVNSSHWRKALKGCDQNEVTPLRLLIKYLPDVAEVVLYRCVQRIQNEKGEVTAIEMCFDCLDDFQDPPGGVFYRCFQALCGGGSNESGPPELSTLQPVRFDKNNHVLKWMVKYKRTNLLQHPVTRELIFYKWRAYVMPGFIINLGIFLLFLATLTSYSAVLPLPNDDMCVNRTRMNNLSDSSCSDSDGDQVFLRFTAIVLLGFCIVRAVLETFQLINRRLQYFTEPENIIEILLIGFTTIFAFAGNIENCFCLINFVWQIGAFAVFLGWIVLILYLRQFPLTGIPVLMLESVVLTFLKLIYLPAILIVSFALPFYMLFARRGVTTPYDTPPYSMMRSLVSTTGELDYSSTFQFGIDDGELRYDVMSYFLWVLFIILMPILFANLLVGLAVGDIQKVEENATLTYLSIQADLAIHTEQKLPWIRRKLKKTSHRVEKSPNVSFCLSWYHKLYEKVSRNSFKKLEREIVQLESQDKLQNLLQGIVILEPVDEVKAHVQRNTDAMSILQNTIDQMNVTINQMKVELERATTQGDNIVSILEAIKELKQDINKKVPPLSSAHS